MMASPRIAATSSTVISGSGFAIAKMIGSRAIDADHVAREGALDGEAEGDVGAVERLGEGAGRRLDRVRRLPLVHALGAAAVHDALGVAEDDVVRLEAERLQELDRGDARRAGAVDDELRRLDVAAGEMERVDEAGRGDDRRAVLVVMEDGDVHQLAQALLDDEALRRLDVLEVDAAEGRRQVAHAVDDRVRVLGADLEVEGVDVGEALEQHRLAFHHRLRGDGAAVAEAEDRGAVRDHRDEVALGGVVEGEVRVLGDRQHRHRDARRIGERQIALRRHRLRRHDLELARPPMRVELQRLLVREGRARAPRRRGVVHRGELSVCFR